MWKMRGVSSGLSEAAETVWGGCIRGVRGVWRKSATPLALQGRGSSKQKNKVTSELNKRASRAFIRHSRNLAIYFILPFSLLRGVVPQLPHCSQQGLRGQLCSVPAQRSPECVQIISHYYCSLNLLEPN